MAYLLVMPCNQPAEPADVISFYERYFLPGMVDLSASSAPTAVLRPTATVASAHSSPFHPPELRAAIASRYRTLTTDDIVLANGASEALAVVAHAILGLGRPYFAAPGTYPSFLAAAHRMGAVRLASPSVPAVVHVVVNPTVPAGQLLDLGEWARRAAPVGAILVADEVYRELTPGGPPPAAADIDSSAVSIGDLSKPLGLGGLRIGWVATRNRALLAAVAREIELLSGGPSTLSAAAAIDAMGQFDRHVAETLAARAANAPAVRELLGRFGWRFEEPAAGLTVAARPPMPISAPALAELRAKGLFVVPGEVLGAPGTLRISLLAGLVELHEALSWLDTSSLDRSSLPRAGGQCELIVLTKAPGAGGAKTRLAAAIGRPAADRLAAAFLLDTLDTGSRGPWRKTLAVAPACAVEAVTGLAPGWTCEPQPEGDLGERIVAALQSSTRRGRTAVLIGSDTPDLPGELLRQAFAALESHDLVLGPAEDGGFYLIGLTATRADLFRSVEWSTPSVLETVLGNAASLGLSVHLLDRWADVDDGPSLDALRRRGHGSPAAATRRVLDELSPTEVK